MEEEERKKEGRKEGMEEMEEMKRTAKDGMEENKTEGQRDTLTFISQSPLF